MTLYECYDSPSCFGGNGLPARGGRQLADRPLIHHPRIPHASNASLPMYLDHSHLRQSVPIRVKAPAFHKTLFCKNEPKLFQSIFELIS